MSRQRATDLEPRRCAYGRCGVEFVPVNARMLYHSLRCGEAARYEGGRPRYRKSCKACRVRLTAPTTHRNFCSAHCKFSFLQARQANKTNPAPIVETVASLLPTGARPLSFRPQTLDEAADARWLLCRCYLACLDHAEAKRWPGFSCMGCALRGKK